jgi:hypothetical protein
MKTNPIDNLHQSVNDIYEQLDMGKIEYKEAMEILKKITEHFLKVTQ